MDMGELIINQILADHDSIVLNHYFNKLPNDKYRWDFVRDNKNNDITVYLCEDKTFIRIKGENGKGVFDRSIGTSNGVMILLDSLEIIYKVI